MGYAIASVDRKKTIQIGSFRVDAHGNQDLREVCNDMSIKWQLIVVKLCTPFYCSLKTSLLHINIYIINFTEFNILYLQVPYARSDVHLTEEFEKVCNKMYNHGLARRDDKRKKDVYIRKYSADGTMVSSDSADFDEDTTKRLKYTVGLYYKILYI